MKIKVTVQQGKKCTRCGEIKPLGMFPVDTKSPDGRRAECPVCGGKIVGTLTTCMKCGYTKGDDTKDPENQAFYKANLERSKVKA